MGNAVLLPGLVNAHTHLELTALRGFVTASSFREWIVRLQQAKVEVMTRERYLDAARLGILEGLTAGITTYADSCDSGVSLQAMAELGVRGIMYQEVFGPDPRDARRSAEELQSKLAAHRRCETALQRVGVSPHAPYTVSAELYGAVTGIAEREALPMMLHAAESREESTLVASAAGPFADALRARGIAVGAHGCSPVALLHRLGVLRGRPLLAHCVQVDAEDLSLLADSGSSVAHCPISNARLGHGVAPVVEMLRAGIVVGLGSDSMASNDRMHLLEESRSAVLLQRSRGSAGQEMTADHALHLATLGGAKALGLDARIGSLEPGKDADLAAFDLGGLATTPAFDPVRAAVFALGGSRAALVAVEGSVLVRDGTPLAADPAIAARVRETAAALTRWRETRMTS
ncbi:MAG: amidohydrolase family protein [Gemmatimonadaceae bacterium]